MNEITIFRAPEAWRTYLDKLVKVCGYDGPVEMAVIAAADMPARVGVTDKPDGFLHLEAGRVPLIILREDIDDTLWQSIVAHELLHLVRWTTDEWVLNHLPESEHDAYMRLVESTMKPLSILLMVGGLMNVKWSEDEP